MPDIRIRAAEQLSDGAEGAAEFVAKVDQINQSVDVTSMGGLLPLAIAILILHEVFTANAEHRGPRIWWMVMRVIAFMGAILCYPRIVGLLTGLLGGGSWANPVEIIEPLEKAYDAHKAARAEDGWMDMKANVQGLVWTYLFMVDCILGAVAFIATNIVIKAQGIFILIFTSIGKTCLILSIVPGVGLAKSWAKGLATVAAWSFMAKIVYSALGVMAPDTSDFATSVSIMLHMKLWLKYAMLVIFTVMIPKLVNSVVSGSVSAAPGVGAALAGGFMAFKAMKLGVSAAKKGTQIAGKAAGKLANRHGGKVSRGLGKAARTADYKVGTAAAGAKSKMQKSAQGAVLSHKISRGASRHASTAAKGSVKPGGPPSLSKSMSPKSLVSQSGPASKSGAGKTLGASGKGTAASSDATPMKSSASGSAVSSPNAGRSDSSSKTPTQNFSGERGDGKRGGGAVPARTTSFPASPRSSDAGGQSSSRPASGGAPLASGPRDVGSSSSSSQGSHNFRAEAEHESEPEPQPPKRRGRYTSKQER